MLLASARSATTPGPNKTPHCASTQADPFIRGGRVGWQAGLSLFLLAGVSACDYLPWDRWAGRKDPVAATRGFLATARRGDCEKAWTYFSPETQSKIRDESKRMIRGAPYYSDVFAP